MPLERPTHHRHQGWSEQKLKCTHFNHTLCKQRVAKPSKTQGSKAESQINYVNTSLYHPHNAMEPIYELRFLPLLKTKTKQNPCVSCGSPLSMVLKARCRQPLRPGDVSGATTALILWLARLNCVYYGGHELEFHKRGA